MSAQRLAFSSAAAPVSWTGQLPVHTPVQLLARKIRGGGPGWEQPRQHQPVKPCRGGALMALPWRVQLYRFSAGAAAWVHVTAGQTVLLRYCTAVP
jgi:hypothetical protein